MKEIKNVLICGIGAIGSIYANIINKYDNENLKILLDKSRYEKYIKTPKIFNGKELKLNYILPDRTDFKADLIIIATKYDGLFDAIENIKNFIKSDTIILSLLNGVVSEDFVARKYGWKHVLHSYFIGHSAMRSGNIITHDGEGYIVFGVHDEKITDKNDELLLRNYFDKVGIKYKNPVDIQHSMWLKFMLNVSCNQSSAILKKTFGQMQKSEKYRKLIKNIIEEVLAIAKIHGVRGTETMVDEVFCAFDTMTSDGKTSMLQDIEAGRKTEVDIFAGTVIELGKKYNIQTPYNKVMKEMIEILES